MRIHVGRLIGIGVLFIFLAPAGGEESPPAYVEILCPMAKPPDPVLTGIAELEKELIREGWTVTKTFGPTPPVPPAAPLQIVIAPLDTEALGKEGDTLFKNVMPGAAESLSILKFSYGQGLRVYAIGSDATGTMYAAFELAGQLRLSSPEQDLDQRVREVQQSPALPVRGIQLMIHRQALEDPYSWYHSSAFWEGFLDTLARNRFNALELQGVYDLATGEYSNLMPYMVFSSEYPQAGLDRLQADANLRSFQRLLGMAHTRGISVTLINSGTGLMTQGSPAGYLPGEQLIHYTRITARQLMDVCPTLDGLGFLVTPSGIPTGFYEQSYLRAVAESPNKPVLALHPGEGSPRLVNELTRAHAGPSVVLVKWNGDHLGLPYPVAGGRMSAWPTASCQDYFNLPHKYSLLYQIGFNGTHRIFPWGDTACIRRTLETARAAGADGFMLQTYSTFQPHADDYTNPDQPALRYSNWTCERDWYEFLFWGWLAYDPATVDSFFVQCFQEHFGADPGARLFNALLAASRVVPAIAAIGFPGPDRLDFAPEMAAPLNLDQMYQLQPLDSFAIRSVTEEIDGITLGKTDGRLSPLTMLDQAAQAAASAVEQARGAGEGLKHIPEGMDEAASQQFVRIQREWKAWMLDFQALEALARYWRGQTGAAVQLGAYLRSGDIPSLVMASENLHSAGAAWKEVQEHTSAHYRPILVPARDGTREFHWQSVPSQIDLDEHWIQNLYQEWQEGSHWPEIDGHFRIYHAPPGRPLMLTLSVPPRLKPESVHVNFKNSEGSTGRLPLEKTRIEGAYYVSIPAGQVTEGEMQYFFLVTLPAEGQTRVIPPDGTPFTIIITPDLEPPHAGRVEHRLNDAKNRVTVTAEFSDPSGIASAKLWWKPLPSTEDWREIPMQGSGAAFTGSFPLTSSGALYAVEAMDAIGNVRRAPDPSRETPYRLIPAFAKGK
ncbi:MAG: hypothetical protein ACE15F_10845 [bacterium]